MIIKCKSDLLVSTGDSFNSTVDVDVCYDELGLVYIPAKRIKGIIREAAFDTNSNELLEILGGRGDRDTKFFIDDAKLQNFAKLSKEVTLNINAGNYYAIDVLDYYTYMRSQTSIKDGVAKPHSLRTMRIIKKGVCFETIIEVEGACKEDRIYGQLENIAKAIRHIGTSRTRGLGRVECSISKLSDDKEDEKKKLDEYVINASEQLKYRLDYTLSLKEPLIMINGDGNRAVSENYIEGSKILGAFIRECSKIADNEKAMKFIDEDFIFSNLYVTDSESSCRFEPVMNSLKHIKNSELKGDTAVYNMVKIKDVREIEKLKDQQLQSYSNKFASISEDKNDIKILGVDKSISYHHRRSANKGRTQNPNKDDDNLFFQIESIAKGQMFKGYVIGRKEQVDAFKKVFIDKGVTKIGYSKTAQYGICKISNSVGELFEDNFIDIKEEDMCYMHLLSPLIIYNKSFMVSSNACHLSYYVDDNFKVDIDKSHISYKTIGGYNVTWKTIKPNINIIDKGSVIAFTYNGTLQKSGFLGERNTEGFGEYKIYKADELNDKLKLIYENNLDTSVNKNIQCTISNEILLKKQLDAVASKAFADFGDIYENKIKGKINSTTISSIIKLLNDCLLSDDKDIKDVLKIICLVSDDDKRKYLMDIFFEKSKEDKKELMIERCKFKNEYSKFDDYSRAAIHYYKTLFTLVKYEIRKKG